MADYGDWMEQEELEEQSSPQLRAPRAPVDPENRKSVVLHNLEVPGAKTGRKPPPIPASRGAGKQPAAPAQETEMESASPDRRGSHSRLFPGLAIQSRSEKIKSGKKLEDYGFEHKWPWAFIALFFLGGGIVMAIFGGWCIQQDPTGNTTPPAGELNACGPGGGLILSSFFFLLSALFSFSSPLVTLIISGWRYYDAHAGLYHCHGGHLAAVQA